MRLLTQFLNPERVRTERERAYMEHSVSLADVERRQREIDAGLFRRKQGMAGF